MIAKHEQKLLKRYLGPQYSKNVLKILSKKRVKNKRGQPHTASYVRMVFQGFRNNADIENAIWELANKNKEGYLARRMQRNKIFKKD